MYPDPFGPLSATLSQLMEQYRQNLIQGIAIGLLIEGTLAIANHLTKQMFWLNLALKIAEALIAILLVSWVFAYLGGLMRA